MSSEKNKCALLDTDFISKLYHTCKDEQNRMIDRVLELKEYCFVCHRYIVKELSRYSSDAKIWLNKCTNEHRIKEFSDKDIIEELKMFYGKNAYVMYKYYLYKACNIFGSDFLMKNIIV